MKVQFLTQRFKKMGHLLTVTKDGILQIWSESFSLLNSFRVRGAHLWSTYGVVGAPLPLYPNSEGDPDPKCAYSWGSWSKHPACAVTASEARILASLWDGDPYSSLL